MSEVARSPRALVIGGFGALGTSIAAQLAADGSDVLRSSRTPRPGSPGAVILPADGSVTGLPTLHAVVWAQGMNVNDSIATFSDRDLSQILEANVALVARQMRSLIEAERLITGARLVVVSSIWANAARPGKFTYTVSKAAISGLVRAAALDLAGRGVLVNAVLPGPVDTPMTRAMLSARQIEEFERSTGHHRLIRPEAVATLVSYLCSPLNTGVSGQSLVVDLGYSIGHQV
ncbi:SDR family NAD(P)-dependent oxidoreductase [Actinotalea subterranea]|uniref:SDR family NAD(P)-dependent oxidoreductase n=1 Tax=Actinotalea subterranea TaxID=2607497 RepID=UPI0011EF37B1|nr:SDR family oxidoreductase [Actinotalea subterranea]